jgi:hypothetical protein
MPRRFPGPWRVRRDMPIADLNRAAAERSRRNDMGRGRYTELYMEPPGLEDEKRPRASSPAIGRRARRAGKPPSQLFDVGTIFQAAVSFSREKAKLDAAISQKLFRFAALDVARSSPHGRVGHGEPCHPAACNRGGSQSSVRRDPRRGDIRTRPRNAKPCPHGRRTWPRFRSILLPCQRPRRGFARHGFARREPAFADRRVLPFLGSVPV